MSWWIDTVVSMSESEELSYLQRKAEIVADDFASLPAYNSQQSSTTDPFILVRGSKAFVLATSKKYILNSQNQWVEIHESSGGGGASSADQVSYDNTDSGLTATNVQAAIDELKDNDDMQDRAISELYEDKATVEDIYGIGVSIPANSNLNDYRTGGNFYVVNNATASTIANIPVTGSGFRLIVRTMNTATYCRQEFYKVNQPEFMYVRTYNGTWSVWYRFTGEALQTASTQSVNPTSTLNLSRNDLNEQLDSNFDLIDSIPEEEEGEEDV